MTTIRWGGDQPWAESEAGPGVKTVEDSRWGHHAFGPMRVFAGVVSGVTQAAEPVMARGASTLPVLCAFTGTPMDP